MEKKKNFKGLFLKLKKKHVYELNEKFFAD